MHLLEYGEVVAVRGKEITLKVNENVINKVLRFRKEGNKTLAELRLNDGRSVTNEQRKKYFATLKDISEWSGDLIECLYDYFKTLYCFKNKVESISMSDCSITEAREMINLVIDFALLNEIPLKDSGIERTDDINRYLYMCLATRKCSICGKPGEVHHALEDRIGMGNNRNKVEHIGRKAICLCREHHSILHGMSETEFNNRYKVYPIKLDKNLVEKLGL